MMKRTSLLAIITISLLLGLCNLASAESEDDRIQLAVKEIDSVEKAKYFLQNNIRCSDPTGCSGYGMWIRAVNVCRLVKAVNIKVGGKIILNSSVKRKNSSLSISRSDTKLMRMIYSQCKSRRYIDSPNNPVELVYWPSSSASEKVDKILFK
jgi:hypothetical protein